MADFDRIDDGDDDIDLPFDRSAPPPPEPPSPDGPPVLPIAVGAVLVLALGAMWYVGRGTAPAPASTATPGVAQTTVDLPGQPARGAAEPGEAIDLPPLDQADAIVRTLVGRLSSHPTVAAWLATDGLIRSLAVAVTNVADGDTPAKHLKPIAPKGTFAVRPSGGLTWIDPASYARYDGIAAAADSLDARGVARVYATIKPRLDEACKELGGPDANVDRTVERAIVMLLRTPVVDDNVQVRETKMTYAFANPSLENLPQAQRQFLRMGPRNVRIVKAKLREVAGFLGIPDSALPPPDAGTPSR